LTLDIHEAQRIGPLCRSRDGINHDRINHSSFVTDHRIVAEFAVRG